MNRNPKEQPNSTFIPSKHFETVKVFEEKSDCDIWNAFNKGDEMAFNYLYRTYVQELYQFGSQYSRDSSLVKDSIQNLFIYLRKKRGDLKEVTNIKGYLFRSIQREIIKNIKANTSIEGFEESFLDSHFQIVVSPEVSFIKSESETERKIQLQRGLSQLTTKQRKAILLFYEEELSYKEIAEIMNFSEVKTARKLIYRALASLKEFIKPTSY
ncbi:RNA polymerase sigma-70 factor (ECF subfamily) [Algoriphagus ratkowskyi]|uniref:RNA polymerase sigma-70 factor (ECF subfamily) n=1 Tax=Algoriphagus ratkowskyi TaxID=57028 RepID=A0A2W7QYY5_9BACT|nr:sigma-70 family RNA polymerase sigma factor [Algoriphagus ratkowskyi]PZX51250.1 RNA polymerase sigma-70 factor (ECF subfamily) [Algoriphagus ratkowskyi]TXD75957.1 sigma-70 family RNA polymerase sigma factor [Algoriphagus ratkowskyi]